MARANAMCLPTLGGPLRRLELFVGGQQRHGSRLTFHVLGDYSPYKAASQLLCRHPSPYSVLLSAADRQLLLGSCGDVHGVGRQDDSAEKDEDSSALSDATTIPMEDTIHWRNKRRKGHR